jgi:hypothetical protein
MPWVHKIHTASIKRRGILPWAVALLFFATSLSARILLEPVLAGMKFLTFHPAIVAATLICGWRQGVFILLLSTVTAWYLFLEPTNSFELKDPSAAGALIGFLLVGAFNIVLVGALRETIRRVELAKSVQETLFRELQHRVANNLQLVVALLRNARRNLRNPVVAAETLNDAEARILAMSELHRRLHDGTAYADGLERLLREMLGHAFRDLPVKVTVDVSGASDLTIDQMTAMTLLVNEAAINAAKHVFSKGLGTRFEVALSKNENGHLHLVIKDDGPGMAGAAETESGSLGMGIMEAFATQLGGSLEVAPGAGTALSVEFAHE